VDNEHHSKQTTQQETADMTRNPLHLAIYASAVNVLGPRSGRAATPATVLGMVGCTELRRYVIAYLCAAQDDSRRAFRLADIDAALDAI
jgi:hypothetical protein